MMSDRLEEVKSCRVCGYNKMSTFTKTYVQNLFIQEQLFTFYPQELLLHVTECSQR